MARPLEGDDLYARQRAAARTVRCSCSMTARPTPTATSISAPPSKDPEGLRLALAEHAGPQRALTCMAGTATACRSNGRSRSRIIAPRARTRTTSRFPSSAPNAAPSPATGWTCSARVPPPRRHRRLGPSLTTMDYRAEAQHRRRIADLRPPRPALSRLQAGDVVAGRAHRARRSRDRIPRQELAPDLGEVPGREGPEALLGARVVIWTTTPWTIPGNRAVSYSPSIAYGVW